MWVDHCTDGDEKSIVYLVLTSVLSVTYSDNNVHSEMLYFHQHNDLFRSIVCKRRIPVEFRIHHHCFIRAGNPNKCQQTVDNCFFELFTTLYEFFWVRSTVSIDFDVTRLEDTESGNCIGDRTSSSPSESISTNFHWMDQHRWIESMIVAKRLLPPVICERLKTNTDMSEFFVFDEQFDHSSSDQWWLIQIVDYVW
jgi:hypothetical protein